MNGDDFSNIGTGREEGYFLNVFLALSRLTTTIFTGASHKVYFSSQSGRWLEQGKIRGKIFVPMLNWFFDKWKKEVNHCQKSWERTRKVLAFERTLDQNEK